MPRKTVNEPLHNPDMAERLKVTRKQAGMTQQEFADELGVKLSHIKALEGGYYGMNPEFIKTWKQKFKKSYQWIFEGI
jgi:transcriptional regulator with XRE-family HTH domain